MKFEHFNKRFAAAVGRLPFPGRHWVGPAALRAIRTPDVQEKRKCRVTVLGLAGINTVTAVAATAIIAADCAEWLRGEQTTLKTAEIGLDGVMLSAHAASAYAQVNIINRINRSINAVTDPSTPFTAGIENPVMRTPIDKEQNKVGRDTALFMGTTIVWWATVYA